MGQECGRNDSGNDASNEWLEPVSDEDYGKLK